MDGRPTVSAARTEAARERGSVAPAHPSRTLSPEFLAWVVGPIALALLIVLRQVGLVASAPIWAYVGAVAVAQITGRLVDRWPDAPRGTMRLHVRIFVHVLAVTSVIYLSGWGPALGMAFAFSALADLQQSGADAWRATLGWSLAGCIVGQLLILAHVAPSFLSGEQAQTIGALGAFVFVISIRMAGAVGEYKEQIENELEAQTAEAARSAAHFRSVVENAAEGILSVALDGSIASFNTAAETMFGWPEQQIIGRPASVLVPEELHEHLENFLRGYRTAGPDSIQRSDVEVTGVRRDGSQFPITLSTSLIAVTDQTPVVSAIVRDLSDQKRFEAQLAHQALHDALTGLPNRTKFVDRLEQALGRVRRHGGMFAVFFVDLDRFKSVNDRLGHTAGDQLLVEVAERLHGALRDIDTVARLGGDEFVILAEDVDTIHNATIVAERIIGVLEPTFHIAGDEIRMSASVGIALCSSPSETAETMLANADIAMYRAKEKGRRRYELFDETMQLWVTSQAELEAALRAALTNDELCLFYQPIIEAGSGVIRGFEALVRWEPLGAALVMPDEFIPLAEETGMIVDIGKWVLNQACVDAAEWNKRWPNRYLSVTVNLSGRQLTQGDLVQVVKDALACSGLEPTLLTLEITESTLIEDELKVNPLLVELRELGVHLALDDFGTGYSSLTYLRTFPFDAVKIDKSFVRALGTEREDTAIVAAVIALAKQLGLHVVAEGVENYAQLAVLHQFDCPFLQGYLFSRPVPLARVASLLDGQTLGLVAARDHAEHQVG
jgi:diguanylate cyclase (GGDEF)-like protein/PAS domain S-box-containing protein